MLISNSGENNQLPCFFCKVVTDTRIRVNQGCTGCKKAFHNNCFTAFHCPGEMGPQTRELVFIVHAAVRGPRKGPKSPSKYVGNMEDFKLKHFDESKKKLQSDMLSNDY